MNYAYYLNYWSKLSNFFPKLDSQKYLKTFQTLLSISSYHGYEPYFCNSEDEARNNVTDLILKNGLVTFLKVYNWKKEVEEFYSDEENVI